MADKEELHQEIDALNKIYEDLPREEKERYDQEVEDSYSEDAVLSYKIDV